MEIIFNKLTYEAKKDSSLKLLNDLNIVIPEGSIVGFLGDDLSIIGKLLLVLKRPTSGEIKVDDIFIKRNSFLILVKNS